MNTMTPPAPAAAPDVAPAPAAAPPPAPKKGGRKKVWIAGAALLLGIGMAIGAAVGSQESDPAPVGAAPAAPAAPAEVPAPAAVPEPTTAPEPPVAEEAPAETAGQENARQSAEGYLDYSAFSRKGLIEQLEYEGYSTKDATYAVDAVSPNWNEQAAKAAKDYLDYSSFSRSGLIEQLEFEGYTHQQAVYGVNQTGL
jgi:hypothetical protein